MSTQPRPQSPAFALLIGIDDYSAHDESRKSPRGTSDLRTGKNDVVACYRLCQDLGIAPENIHVLTSPALAERDIAGPSPGFVGGATRAEIEAQLAWLSQRLAPEAGKDAPVGLLSYSGHGDFAGDDLALCPSDVRVKEGGDLENVLGFQRVDEILRGRPGATDNLTVVLDCSFAATGDAWGPGKRSSLTGRGPGASRREARHLGACSLFAAKPGDVARQSTFGGRAHGALTWALSIVAEQMRAHGGAAGREMAISQGDLVERARRLLDALSLSQTVTLAGPAGAKERRFFHGGNIASFVGAGATATGAKPGSQIDPDIGKDYTLYDIRAINALGGATLAQVLVVRVAGRGYQAGLEYWSISSGFISATQDAIEVSVSASIKGNFADGDPVWGGSASAPTQAIDVDWPTTTESLAGSFYAPGTNCHYAVKFVTASPLDVRWYIRSSEEPDFGTPVVTPAAAVTFNTTAPGSGPQWHKGT